MREDTTSPHASVDGEVISGSIVSLHASAGVLVEAFENSDVTAKNDETDNDVPQ